MARSLAAAALAVMMWWAPAAAAQDAPRVSITKGPDLQAVPAGTATDVTWTITVSNPGTGQLATVSVTDPQAPNCDRTVGALAPGESVTYDCRLEGVSLSATDALVNTATVNALGPGDVAVSASDEASVVAVEVAASGIIGDTVWDDVDGNGLHDDGEPGIPGVEVVLTDLAGGATSSATTNGDGRYLFAALDPGTYRVEPATPPGRLTTPNPLTVELGEGRTYLDADFGVMQTLPTTGGDIGPWAMLGAGLVAVGAILLTIRVRSGRPAPPPGAPFPPPPHPLPLRRRRAGRLQRRSLRRR